jgi:Fe/S biogenesis protein NfuA
MGQMVIEEAAYQHFIALLQAEGDTPVAIRLHVEGIGGAAPEVVIAFCPEGQQHSTDLLKTDRDLRFFIDASAKDALEEVRISYEETPMGGQLVVHAPHLKAQIQAPSATSALRDRIEWVLDTEIRPQLAMHHGEVWVEGVTEEHDLVLGFGGGCKGCSMVNYTLKYGIEEKIKVHCPEIRSVIDKTDHAAGENPYYG